MSLLVVGAGRMGKFHRDAVRRGTAWSLAGIVDLDPNRLMGLGCAVDCDLERALGSLRPDAVVVAVPPELHESIARVCLAHGCHVLLEKPICPSFPTASRLSDDFRRAGRVLFGGHSERFHPVFQALRARSAMVGEIVRVEAVRYGPLPERVSEGGVVMDLAIHDLDLVRRVVGVPMRVEGAEIERIGWTEARMLAELAWDGGKALVDAGWRLERQRVLCVTGKRGTLEADLLGRSLVLRTPCGEEWIKVPWSDPLEAEQAAFRAACEGMFDAEADLAPQIEAVDLAERILSF